MEIDTAMMSIRHNHLRAPNSKTMDFGVIHIPLKGCGGQEQMPIIGLQVCVCLWVERPFPLSTASRKVVHVDILLIWDSLL